MRLSIPSRSVAPSPGPGPDPCRTASSPSARKAPRADGLDAVRQGSGPGPGDGATDRDGIDSRIRAPVVATHELDAGAGGHRAHRAASPAATAPAVPTPTPTPTAAVHTCAAITAASRQRR